jgi:hypothetical protein
MVTTRITEYRLSGSTATGDIFIEIGGTITGAGQPVAGAWVRIEDGLGSSLGIATTDNNGRFLFGGLTRGAFLLRARAQGFNEATRTVDVPSPSGNYDVQLI